MSGFIKGRISFLARMREKYHRQIPTVALLVGFLWDFFTLARPDRIFDNVVFVFYLVLAGVFILFLAYKKEQGKEYIPLWQLIIVQFSFGALASGLLVLYGKSGTLVGNWPFLLIFVVLLVGNEFLRGRYAQTRFNVSLYYIFVFAYCALIVPVLLKSVEAKAFVISGLVSLGVIAPYIFAIRRIAPNLFRENKEKIRGTIVAIFIAFNVLYFANLIPPVPLALRDIGVYHRIVRSGDVYQVSFEKGKRYEFWKHSDSVLHLSKGEGASCFSSVYAPTKLTTPIYHRWEHYDEETGEWLTSSRVAFQIVGGRSGGYRGYSVKGGLADGKWRCDVETERGLLIGRSNFTVVHTDDEYVLVTETR